MWGATAALHIFLRWGSKRKTKQEDIRSLVAPSAVQPASTWWGGGDKETALALAVIGSLGADLLTLLKAFCEDCKDTWRRGSWSLKNWIHASSSRRGQYGIPWSSAVRGIKWNSPDPLHRMIKYKMGNDERLCKCTAAVFLGDSVNPWLTNGVSALRTADSLCSPWVWGLPRPAGVCWARGFGSSPCFHDILFYTLESLHEMLLG